MKNMKPSLRGKILLLSLGLSAVYAPYASATVTYFVGGCYGGSKPTITAALTATPAPDVVKVCPGTYPEQVIITNPVTLEGISFDGADQPTVAAPAGGLNNCDGIEAQVCALGVGPVNISNLTVDGSGTSYGLAGIAYMDSSGTINHVETRFQDGCDCGFGIYISGGDNSVTIKNSNLHSFDQTGIAALDDGSNQLNVQIEGNTLDLEPGTVGIQVLGGASSTLTGNTIVGGAPPCSAVNAGDCGSIVMDGTPSAGSISENTIMGSAVGILLAVGENPTTMSVTSNTIFDISGDGIQLYGTGVPIQGNIITQAQNGVNFECNLDNNVGSNTIAAIHSYALANVASGENSANIYYNVPAFYNLCP